MGDQRESDDGGGGDERESAQGQADTELRQLQDELAEARWQATVTQAAAERYYRSLLTALLEDIVVVDRDFRVTDINNLAIQVVGVTREEAIGQYCYTLLHGLDAPCPQHNRPCALQRVFDTGEPALVRKAFRHTQGSPVEVELLMSPLRDERGQVTHIVEAVRDVSDLVAIQERLRMSESRHRTTLHSIGDAVIAVNTSGEVELINPTAEALTGWEQTEALGQPLEQIFRIVNEHTRRAVESPAARVLREGRVVGLANHTLLLARDGREIPIADSGAPIIAEDGRVAGVVLVFRDQTAERSAQQALKASEERFRRVSAAMVDIAYSCAGGPPGGFALDWMVGAAEEMVGYSISEILEQGCWRFMVCEEDLPLFDRLVTGLAPGEQGICTLQLRHKDGTVIWVESSAECVRCPEGSDRLYLYGGLVDVTARHKAETAERQRAELDAALAELSLYCLAPGARVEKAAETLLDRLLTLTGSADGYVASMPAETGSLVCHAYTNIWECGKQKDALTRPVGAEGLLAQALRNREPFFDNEVAAHPAAKDRPRGHAPVSNLLSYPIVASDQLLGHVALANKPGGYVGHDLERVRRLADLFGIFLWQARTQQALAASEARYRLFLENFIGIAYQAELSTFRPTMFHGQVEAITGYSADELVSGQVRWDELVYPEDLPIVVATAERFREDPQSVATTEYRIRRKDGEMRWVIDIARVLVATPGGPVLQGAIYDRTARRQAEEESRRNTARLRSLVRILQHEADTVQGLLDFALHEALQLTESRYGYIYFYSEERRQFTLNTWSSEVMQACTVANPQSIYDLDKTGVWGEAVRQRRPIILNDFQAPHALKKGYPAGHAELYRYMTVPVFSGERIVAVVGAANKASDYDENDVLQLTLLMDAVWKVVERRQAQAALRRIEWMLSPGSRPDPTAGTTDYGDLTVLNDRRLILEAVGAQTLTDIVRDYVELVETSAAVYEINGDYALGIFSSGWCRLMDRASRALCQTADNREALASGRWLCHESCWNRACKACIESGEPVDVECDGGLRLYAAPIRAAGEVVGALNMAYGDPPTDRTRLLELAELYGVAVEELTRQANAYPTRPPFVIEMAKRRMESGARLIGEIVERRQLEAERERLHGQLIQAQKMESVGRLAGGVAHDFNNMLSVILGRAELALLRGTGGDALRVDLREIREAALRSAKLTQQLLAFARKQTIDPRVLDLNDAVGGMLKMLRRLIGEDIELAWLPGHDLWPVLMDPSQIDQILANLLVNARDAISGVGRVTIETENVTLDEEYCTRHAGFLEGQYVLLAVSDNGCGLSPEAREHLFEPFFTTKDVGQGTGLGLSTVYGIVRQNDGFINVYSEPGAGTTFKIYLRRHGGKPEAPADAPDAEMRGGDETVLLLEDDPALLEAGQTILEMLGYRVLAARVPQDAIQLASEHDGEIHLLVTDVIMPELNGREVARQIQAVRPGVRCLFMSGYTANVVTHHGVLDAGVHFLHKPFSIEGLAAKVREVLDHVV